MDTSWKDTDLYKNAELKAYSGLEQLSSATGVPKKLLKIAKDRNCEGFYARGRVNWKKAKPEFEKMLDDIANLVDDDISFWKKENAKLDAELKVLQKKKLERNTFDADEIKQLLVELAAKVSVVINAAIDEIPAPSAGKSDIDIKIVCDAAKKKIFTMLEKEMAKTVK